MCVNWSEVHAGFFEMTQVLQNVTKVLFISYDPTSHATAFKPELELVSKLNKMLSLQKASQGKMQYTSILKHAFAYNNEMFDLF